MIGIVGGIGPLAGADLVKKITEETHARKDQEHLPVILFSFPGQIPDRTEFLEGKIAVNPGIRISEICLQLERTGATIAAIACNTAHAPAIMNKIVEKLDEAKSQLQIVHLVDENIANLRRVLPPGSNVGVLSTTGTYHQRIYYEKIQQAGFTCIVPGEDVQKELVHPAIYHTLYGIKSNSRNIVPLVREQIRYVMDMLKDNGANAILLGCSELPLAMHDDEYRGMMLIDSTRVLAQALVKTFKEKK